jgi:hypothetical protein
MIVVGELVSYPMLPTIKIRLTTDLNRPTAVAKLKLELMSPVLYTNVSIISPMS